MALRRVKAWLFGAERPKFPDAAPEQLEPLRTRRFPTAAPDRLARLWSEIARICGVDPLQLHEDDRITKLCPGQGALDLNLKIMELEALVAAESKHMPPPATRPQTVGDIIDYLIGE